MKKFKKIIFVIFINLLLFSFFNNIYGEDLNSIVVYKLTNKNNTKPNFVYDMKVGLSQEMMKNHELVPIVGAKIGIYKVDRYDKEYWDKQSNAELGEPLEILYTNQDGSLKFKNLSDGIYYIRDLSDDYVANSIIVKLPYEENGKIIRDLYIYLKSSTPPTPPTPPDNPPIPPSGRHFLKVDNTENHNPLYGAYFKVVKKDEDGKFSSVIKDGVEYIVNSNKDGMVFVGDIPYGEYYLIETIAPNVDGIKYKPLIEPVRFVIDELSAGDSPIVIENAPTTPPPNTPPNTPPSTPPDNPPNNPPDNPPNTPPSTPPDVPPTTPGIQIPKTGDIQIFLYVIGGLILFVVGYVGYRKERIEDNV